MITDQQLNALRNTVRSALSEKRFSHTLGVEECARELGEMFLPEEELNGLCAAALLHDITKELSEEEHLRLIRQEGITLPACDVGAVALYHAVTAPIVIRRDYPDFADPQILRAVRLHTVGEENMNNFEKIIFLADYVEKNRTYISCVNVRDYLFGSLAEGEEDPLRILDTAVLKEIDFTMTSLIRKGAYLSEATLRARNSILRKLSAMH